MLFFELFSLNLSRLFHCSVIKVLCPAVLRDNFYILSQLSAFVNRFFYFFISQHHALARWNFIIAPNFMPVNSFFHFFYLYRQGYPHCRIYCSSRTVSTALLLVRYGESKFLSFHRFLYLLAYNFIVGFGCL